MIVSSSAVPILNRALDASCIFFISGSFININNTNENPILGGRVFSPPVVSGAQWRPQTAAPFQNQSETVCTSCDLNFIFTVHLPSLTYTS